MLRPELQQKKMQCPQVSEVFILFSWLDELDFEDYTGIKNSVKNQVRKGQKLNFVQLNFSNLIYQKSSADQ